MAALQRYKDMQDRTPLRTFADSAGSTEETQVIQRAKETRDRIRKKGNRVGDEFIHTEVQLRLLLRIHSVEIGRPSRFLSRIEGKYVCNALLIVSTLLVGDRRSSTRATFAAGRFHIYVNKVHCLSPIAKRTFVTELCIEISQIFYPAALRSSPAPPWRRRSSTLTSGLCSFLDSPTGLLTAH